MTTFTVTCADGAVRHAEPFTSRADARRWAEWGHCCLAKHDIREHAVEVARFATAYESRHGCEWCGTTASPLVTFGSLYRGQMHWSPAYCSLDCRAFLTEVAS